jgi:hypothetical protein
MWGIPQERRSAGATFVDRLRVARGKIKIFADLIYSGRLCKIGKEGETERVSMGSRRSPGPHLMLLFITAIALAQNHNQAAHTHLQGRSCS